MESEELLAHADFIRALSRRLVLDEHRAADVEQDAWIAALEHSQFVRKSLRSWLSRVVRNAAYLIHRSEKNRAARERASLVPVPAPSPENTAIREETLRRMTEAVLALADPYRTTVLLRFYDNLTLKQVADRMGVPLATAKTRLRRALETLRNNLDDMYKGNRRDWLVALAPFSGIHLAMPAAKAANVSGILTGALAMSTKFKMAVSGILLLAAGLTMLLVLSGDDTDANKDHASAISGSRELPAAVEDRGVNPEDGVAQDEKVALKSDSNSLVLTGRVISRSDAEPIDNADVVAYVLPYKERNPVPRGSTDSTGSFEIILPEEYAGDLDSLNLRLSASGYKNLETNLPVDDSERNVDCGCFYLRKNRIHQVRIVDRAGRPIPAARLELFKENHERPFVDRTADSDGIVKIPEDQIEWSTWLWTDSLIRVTGAEIATHLAYLTDMDVPPRDNETPLLPSEIIVDRDGTWNFRIVEKGTDTGVPGAKVQVRRSRFMEWSIPIGSEPITTDEAGYFQLDRSACPRGRRLAEIIANADGYIPGVHLVDEDLPDRIELERATLVKRARLIDSSTGNLLPGLRVEVFLYAGSMEKVTDAAGEFDFPLIADRECYFSLSAPGYEPVSFSPLKPEDLAGGSWTIELTPLSSKRKALRINVQDELARPVSGAMVEVSFHRAGDGAYMANDCLLTDISGEALFHPTSTKISTARLTIKKAGFRPIQPDPIRLEGDKHSTGCYTLRRGFLFQNIRVVDETGRPVPGEVVVGFITLKDGSSAHTGGISDAQGFCDMAFPEFESCRICIRKRPDTLIEIRYESLLAQDWIPLVLPRNVDTAPKFTGTVMDESRRPLGGVVLHLSVIGEESGLLSRTMISEVDGSFSVLTPVNLTYRLSSPLRRRVGRYSAGDESWYTTDEIAHIKAGDDLTVIMKSFNCVTVSLEGSMKFPRDEYEAWLETNGGSTLSPLKTLKYRREVNFVGVPAGTMRSGVRTKAGIVSYTPYFTVHQDRCTRNSVDLR